MQDKQQTGQACQNLGDGVGDVVNVDIVGRKTQLPYNPTGGNVATVRQSLRPRVLTIKVQYLDIRCRPSVLGGSEGREGGREGAREEGRKW